MPQKAQPCGPAPTLLTALQAPARSTRDRSCRLVSNTFIFSTRQVSAVSVASPTFSYTPLAWRGPGYRSKGKGAPQRAPSLTSPHHFLLPGAPSARYL